MVGFARDLSDTSRSIDGGSEMVLHGVWMWSGGAGGAGGASGS